MPYNYRGLIGQSLWISNCGL
ncbi:uncharacterized protein FFFS_06141 [Fusarium fujikuroi]|nr:uncharacterized protein FFFS_06141 [Fusarium fujikuroi]